MALLSISGILLLVWSTFQSGLSLCNYVLHKETGTAWSTEVCIPMGSSKMGATLGYMKFSCPTLNDINQTVVYTELYTSELCDTEHFVSRTILNQTLAPYTFECGGVDGCYVSYVQRCNDPTQEQLVASPTDTCVVTSATTDGTTRVFSFMYTCDKSEMVYTSFTNDNCDTTGTDVSLHITDCTEAINLQSWQFKGCHSNEMMDSTQTPTSVETHSTTQSNAPNTNDIPFYNMSWAQIQQYANAESSAVAITVFAPTFHCLLLLFAMIMA